MGQITPEIGGNMLGMITITSAIAAVCIMGTAWMLAEDQCVDEKIAVAAAEGMVAKAKLESYQIPPGICVNYPSTAQTICRKSAKFGGQFYIKDFLQDATVVGDKVE